MTLYDKVMAQKNIEMAKLYIVKAQYGTMMHTMTL